MNEEKIDETEKTDETYMLVALRRKSPNKGENLGLDKVVRRRVVCSRRDDDYQTAANEFAETFSEEKGFWRMYRSVNRRDLTKTMKALQIKLILHGDVIEHKIDTEWKSIMMQKENKAERLFLVDIDNTDNDYIHSVIDVLKENGLTIKEQNSTPNGHHIIVDAFNPILFSEFKDVEIKKDALFFLFSFGDSSN